MTRKALRISVVMATYNRAETIAITLNHLAEQTLDPASFEVIVVDDGSTDGTENVVRTMQPALPFHLTYVKHPNRGPGYTQNRGIRMAQAPIICLMADDIHFAPDALAAHLRFHERHPDPEVAVLGKVLQSRELAAESVFLAKWDPFKFRHLENYQELPYYLFWACNVSCKRDFLLQSDLFREARGRAGAAAHEDVELGYRLSKRGLRLFYAREALGYHYHLETLHGAMARAYQRGLNWDEFRELVDEPEITVRYHILSRHTLKDHMKTFLRPNNLIGADRNLLYLLIRQMVRMVCFNIVTIPLFWRPVMDLAEKNTLAGAAMHRQLYRGVIAYHFFKGAADGRRMFAEPRTHTHSAERL